MGKVTIYVPNDVRDYIFPYMDEDETIASYQVVDTLPRAKEHIITQLRLLIEQAEKLKLRDINHGS
jgi:hypothetical protein